jgi:hypothetical protein
LTLADEIGSSLIQLLLKSRPKIQNIFSPNELEVFFTIGCFIGFNPQTFQD